MKGAILGDIIGSPYSCESLNIHTTSFDLFGEGCSYTDDTVTTIAVAHAILGSKESPQYEEALVRACFLDDNRGYGAQFHSWFNKHPIGRKPYGSWGNGAAMRVSPIGWAYDSDLEVMNQAVAQASVSHNHPESYLTAQMVAHAILMARYQEDRAAIMQTMFKVYGQRVNLSPSVLRKNMAYTTRAILTVPQAINCALVSTSFEEAVRTAVSIGGDSDTIASIAGAVAEAMFGIPPEIESKLAEYLPEEYIKTIRDFYEGVKT